MADINLKTETPDTSLPTTGFLFGADSQAAASPSVFTTQAIATTLLGSTTLSGATITADAPVLNMSQTWNNGAVTFTGLKYNATDTASGAASLLMELQVGGASRFSVTKGGLTTIGSNLVLGSGSHITSSGSGRATLVFNVLNAAICDNPLGSTVSIGLGTSTGGTLDVLLTRRGAANLRFGAADAAAPVAQTLSVQSVVAGTSNTAGANLTITGSQGTGTGAGGSIIFQVAPAGSSGTAQNALVAGLTLAPAGTSGAAIRMANSGNSSLPEYSWAGRTTSGFVYDPINGNRGVNYTHTGSLAVGFSTNGVYLTSLGAITWAQSSTNPLDGAVNVQATLFADAANTLALRNGANAQTARVYGTFTDASNYRRLALTMSTAGVAEIKPEGAGTGASGNVIHISGLPTSNPGPGILWNNAGTPAIGT